MPSEDRAVGRRVRGKQQVPAPQRRSESPGRHYGQRLRNAGPSAVLYITVSLYLGMIAQARRQGIERRLLLTEVRIASHLSRLGVRVQHIGGPVEHRGSRVPSLIMVDEVSPDSALSFVRSTRS